MKGKIYIPRINKNKKWSAFLIHFTVNRLIIFDNKYKQRYVKYMRKNITYFFDFIRIILGYIYSGSIVIIFFSICTLYLYITVKGVVTWSFRQTINDVMPFDSYYLDVAVLVISPIALFILYTYLLAFSLRLTSPKIFSDDFILRKKNVYGIYLRSFRSDIKFYGKSTEYNVREMIEERLLVTLCKILPIYSVGNPIDYLPAIGVPRIVVQNNWQEFVSTAVANSNLTLITITENLTEGLLWEISCVMQKSCLQKIVFILDFKNDEDFQIFKCRLTEAFGIKDILDDASFSSLLTFNDNGAPSFTSIFDKVEQTIDKKDASIVHEKLNTIESVLLSKVTSFNRNKFRNPGYLMMNYCRTIAYFTVQIIKTLLLLVLGIVIAMFFIGFVLLIVDWIFGSHMFEWTKQYVDPFFKVK